MPFLVTVLTIIAAAMGLTSLVVWGIVAAANHWKWPKAYKWPLFFIALAVFAWTLWGAMWIVPAIVTRTPLPQDTTWNVGWREGWEKFLNHKLTLPPPAAQPAAPAAQPAAPAAQPAAQPAQPAAQVAAAPAAQPPAQAPVPDWCPTSPDDASKKLSGSPNEWKDIGFGGPNNVRKWLFQAKNAAKSLKLANGHGSYDTPQGSGIRDRVQHITVATFNCDPST